MDKTVSSASNDNEKRLMSKVKELKRRISDLEQERRPQDLESGSSQLQKKVEQAENNLKKSNNMLEKYKQMNVKLEEDNKKLSLERSDLKHRCEKLVGLCKQKEIENTELIENNRIIGIDLNKAVEDNRLSQLELKRFRSREEDLATSLNLQTLNDRLKEEKEILRKDLDSMQSKHREMTVQLKESERAKTAAEERMAVMQCDNEKKQLKITLTLDEMEKLKQQLEREQNKTKRHHSNAKNAKELEELLKTQEYESAKIQQLMKNDVSKLQAELKDTQRKEKEGIDKMEALANEKYLLECDLLKATDKIGTLKEDNLSLEARIQQLDSMVEEKSENLKTANSKIDLLEAQMYSMKELNEMMKAEADLREKKEQEISKLVCNVTKLEAECDSLRKTSDSLANDKCVLLKKVKNLERKCSRFERELAEKQEEVDLLSSALSEHVENHYLMLKKVTRESNNLSRKSKPLKRRRRQTHWADAMAQMLQDYRLTGRKQVHPSKILHQTCINKMNQLKRENDELRSRLGRGLDQPYKELYYCKRDLEKMKTENEKLNSECERYQSSYLREKEEKEMWMRKVKSTPPPSEIQ